MDPALQGRVDAARVQAERASQYPTAVSMEACRRLTLVNERVNAILAEAGERVALLNIGSASRAELALGLDEAGHRLASAWWTK